MPITTDAHLAPELREKAERILRETSGPDAAPATGAAHELRLARVALGLQAESLAALRLEAEKCRAAFDLAPIGYFSTDTRGDILEVNPAGAEMLGLPPAAVAGRALIDFAAPGDREALAAHLTRALEAGPLPADADIRFLQPDGTEIPVILRSRLVGGDGDERRCLSAAMDVTACVLARSEADNAILAKNQFLANMSHEIRTPLNGILGLTELTLATELSDWQRRNLTMVRESGMVLLNLLNDILDLARIEAGNIDLILEDFDLPQMLATVQRMFSIEALSKNVSLSYRILNETPLTLKGDVMRLRQVLINLVGNAMKFTEKGSVEIVVGPADPEAPPSRTCKLLFQVTDSGCGVPTEKLASIFEAFTQADGSFSRRYQGSGLGLSISKRLVELMHGRIWVESRPGLGSTFAFTATFENPQRIARRANGDPQAYHLLPSLRVLLAEDNTINQVYVGSLLEQDGHTVVRASNGEEAVAMFLREPFDLILMDVQMPIMDGMEATRRIRAMQDGRNAPHTPIVALTAHAMNGDRERFLRAGMDDYIAKPFEQTELLRVISRVMRR